MKTSILPFLRLEFLSHNLSLPLEFDDHSIIKNLLHGLVGKYSGPWWEHIGASQITHAWYHPHLDTEKKLEAGKIQAVVVCHLPICLLQNNDGHMYSLDFLNQWVKCKLIANKFLYRKRANCIVSWDRFSSYACHLICPNVSSVNSQKRDVHLLLLMLTKIALGMPVHGATLSYNY